MFRACGLIRRVGQRLASRLWQDVDGDPCLQSCSADAPPITLSEQVAFSLPSGREGVLSATCSVLAGFADFIPLTRAFIHPPVKSAVADHPGTSSGVYVDDIAQEAVGTSGAESTEGKLVALLDQIPFGVVEARAPRVPRGWIRREDLPKTGPKTRRPYTECQPLSAHPPPRPCTDQEP